MGILMRKVIFIPCSDTRPHICVGISPSMLCDRSNASRFDMLSMFEGREVWSSWFLHSDSPSSPVIEHNDLGIAVSWLLPNSRSCSRTRFLISDGMKFIWLCDRSNTCSYNGRENRLIVE